MKRTIWNAAEPSAVADPMPPPSTPLPSALTGNMHSVLCAGRMTRTGKPRCCWRQCDLTATEFDTGPQVCFCRFHREAVCWMHLIEELGGEVPPKTPPFLLPVLFLKTVGLSEEELGRITICTDADGCYFFRIAELTASDAGCAGG